MSDFQPSRVLENLYISGILGVTEQNINLRNIRLVIDLTTNNESIKIDKVEIFKIEIDDDPEVMIYQYFDTCADKIRAFISQSYGVLVHCMAGVSRSATICIAYLMKYESMTLLEAYQHLKEARPQIRPNPGFFEQLIEYEKNLYNGYATVNMISSSIGKIPDVYKIEQNSSLGYFWPLEFSVNEPVNHESLQSNDSLQGGNDADDEASVSNITSSSDASL